MAFTGFYWVLLGFYWVSLGFTGFYWVLLGFTELDRVPTGSNGEGGTDDGAEGVGCQATEAAAVDVGPVRLGPERRQHQTAVGQHVPARRRRLRHTTSHYILRRLRPTLAKRHPRRIKNVSFLTR